MSRARLVALLALMPACGAFDACLDQQKTPIVYVDIVDRLSKVEGVDLPRPRLESGARTVMDTWSDFAFRHKDEGEAGWQLDLEVRLATERTADPVGEAAPDPDRVHRAVEVMLRLHALDKTDRQPDEVTAQALLTRDEARKVPFGDLAEDAVVEAGRRLETAMDLYWEDPSAILPALDDERDWVRAIAADAAAHRRLAAAVEPLMARVRDEDESPDVRIHAVGALVALGDPRAASAIIDATRRKNAPYLVQMVFALGALGGRKAEAYLFTVQSGHPSPQVREAARQALEELEKKRARSKAKPAPDAAVEP